MDYLRMIIDEHLCNSSCGNFANLSLNRRYIYCIKKICPCKKKRHISILVLQYHIEIQCHIKLAVCLHIFLKGFIWDYSNLLCWNFQQRNYKLQIKKLKSIWAQQSFIKYILLRFSVKPTVDSIYPNGLCVTIRNTFIYFCQLCVVV